MGSIGTVLRMARERQGLSIDDIVESTRISKKILQDIEDGTVQNFPETYIRAFHRAYAEAVGIHLQELSRQDDTSNKNQIQERVSLRNEEAGNAGTAGTSQSFSGSPKRLQNKQRRVLIIFSLALVGGLVVSLYSLHTNHNQPDVKETAFQDVVREWDKKFSVRMNDSLANAKQLHAADSLKLLGIAMDSVWVRLKIDNGVSHNYLLKPQQRMYWQAGDSILFSLGNAGGIAFSLNGLQLGLLGKKGKSLQNISFTSQTLRDLREGTRKITTHEKK